MTQKSVWSDRCEELATHKRVMLSRDIRGGEMLLDVCEIDGGARPVLRTFAVKDYAKRAEFWQAVYEYLQTL